MPTIRSWLPVNQVPVETKRSREQVPEKGGATLGRMHLPIAEIQRETPELLPKLLLPKQAPRPALPRIAKLPLKLKVRNVRRSPQSLEIDSIVTDAEGVSVSYEPLTMNAKTPSAAVMAILQHHVKCIAESMVKRNLASVESSFSSEDDALLVGMEFLGSAVSP